MATLSLDIKKARLWDAKPVVPVPGGPPVPVALGGEAYISCTGIPKGLTVLLVFYPNKVVSLPGGEFDPHAGMAIFYLHRRDLAAKATATAQRNLGTTKPHVKFDVDQPGPWKFFP